MTPIQRQKRMEKIVGRLQRYIATYSDQKSFRSYSDATLIDDVLYGLGSAIAPEKFTHADGYEHFKSLLRKHIGSEQTP